MLVGCGEHARAICRISVVELRRVAPPAFTLLMVVSLLLADGLLPVLAAKYRSEAALYINGNTARSNTPGAAGGGGGGGGGAIQGRSSSKVHNMNNNRFRAKIRVKSFVSKSGDSFLVGDGGGSYSKQMRPYARLSLNGGAQVHAKNGEDEVRKKSLPPYATPSRDGAIHPLVPPSTSSSPTSHSSAVWSSSSPSPSLLSHSPPASPRSPLQCPLDCSAAHGNSSKEAGSGTCPGGDLVFRCASRGTSDVFKHVCPVLTPELAGDVCQCRPTERAWALEKVRLSFCSTYSAASVTCTGGAPDCPVPGANASQCRAELQAVIKIDEQVRRDYQGFEDLISRYDCRSKYSVKWGCVFCKHAYKNWLCSQKLPFFHSGRRWSPCVEFCTNVEEMCPFFRPKIETHAGDPSFICKDHQINLPNTSSNKNCYGPCHLWSPAEIAEANCSHPQRPDVVCPLLKDCNGTEALQFSDSIGDSTNTNSNSSSSSSSNLTSTSGASPRRTYKSSVLPCMTLAYLLGLSLTLTHFPYLTIGLT